MVILTKSRLKNTVEMATVTASHGSLLSLMLQQVLFEVARMAVGGVADMTLVGGSG